MTLIEINENKFTADVIQQKGVFIVLIYSEFNITSAILKNNLLKTHKEYFTDITICIVSKNKFPDKPDSIEATDTPQLLIYNNGKLIDKKNNIRTKAELNEYISTIIYTKGIINGTEEK